MQVSFIIPLYNCLAHTQECLRTLQATLPAGLAHEIIFVDDGSTDGTRAWLATLSAPCRIILNEQNLGFAGACNRAAAVADSEFLFFLNNDLVLLPGWFGPMLGLLDRPHTALVGNIQLSVRSGTLDHAGVRFNEKGKPEHDRTRPLLARLRGWREVTAVTGACFGIRRTVWERLGGFDPGFRNGGEDVDLALRAGAAGLRTLVSLRSVVGHHVSASLGRKLRDEHNSRRLAVRWRGAIVSLSARAWARHHITTLWDRSCVFDDALARAALWAALGGTIAHSVLDGMQSAFEREIVRWHVLLDGAAPPVERSRAYPPRI
ncbi:glycosyltransferase family 2 protein [Oleiharenicola sp. Vm1]|uniref:glycosyltransferase family 2 protein n=1 Tax=Oleiharenicola sp. Vm1 TaxID=3398393 RepID=UPI0039F57F54